MTDDSKMHREELLEQLANHQDVPLKIYIWDVEIEDYIEGELSDVMFENGEIVVRIDAKG